MDLSDLWSSPSAVWLREAWWAFADPYAKEQYRKTHDRAGIDARRMMMQVDLIADIYSGTFLALAIQGSPDVGDQPEIIPSLYFDNPDIDWTNSTVRAYGRTYEGVKVIPSPEGDGSQGAKTTDRKGRGRPTVAEHLREVVRELEKLGHLNQIPRKEQENRVRVLARQRYPYIFPRTTQPSRTTILKALREEGFF
jgi:hypothetical protein